MTTLSDWGSAREVYENIKPKMYTARCQRLSKLPNMAKKRQGSIGVNTSSAELPPYDVPDVIVACEDQIVRRGGKKEKNGLRLMQNTHLEDKAGNAVKSTSLQGKVVGLYFSAHWCGPCRQFTPQLRRKYMEINRDRRRFEVIFVSADRSQAEFDSYYSEMPWLKMAFDGSTDMKDSLNELYQVEGIPTLVLLDRKGNLLTLDGRSKVLMQDFEDWDPNDDGTVFDDGSPVALKQEEQQLKYEEAEPEDDDDGGGGSDDDDIMESLEQACAELGYSPQEMENFLTSRDFPEELIALLTEKTGKKAGDVRRMIVPQSAKLLQRVKLVIKQMEEAKTKEEELRQEKLRKLGKCPMNFEWIKVEGGYRCAGGSHFCNDDEIDAYCLDE
jgi:thiol-disulfide isomerase/thioredoxin